MRFRPSAACAALALGVLLPAAAAAQSSDAFVLPFGMFRLGVEATHASYDAHFDADGNRVRVGGELGGELTPARFTALEPLATTLATFLEATQGTPGASPDPPDPALSSMGVLDVAASASHTAARARLAVGILPRVELGASLPIGRGDRVVDRFSLSGGNLGVNPDPAANGALLATIGWEDLGGFALLPTAESSMGIELQSRVTELTGDPLVLPEDTVNAESLQAILGEVYGFDPVASRIERWRAGDLEIDARALLLSTFGSAPRPVDRDVLDFRVALLGGVRIATGEAPDTIDLLTPQPTEGLASMTAGAAADLFLGSRWWLSGSLRFTRGRDSEVIRRVTSPETPLESPDPPVAVTITPGDVTELRISPRYRLDRSISLGGEYLVSNVGDTRFTGGSEARPAELLNLSGGGLQSVGVEIRYSSLEAYWVGEAALPAEVTLAYQRTLSGPERAPAGGMLTLSASVFPRLW